MKHFLLKHKNLSFVIPCSDYLNKNWTGLFLPMLWSYYLKINIYIIVSNCADTYSHQQLEVYFQVVKESLISSLNIMGLERLLWFVPYWTFIELVIHLGFSPTLLQWICIVNIALDNIWFMLCLLLPLLMSFVLL